MNSMREELKDDCTNRLSQVKQKIRKSNILKYELENPFNEAQFLDGRFGESSLNEVLNIEPILFEEKMKELNEENDFDKLYGFKVPKTDIELQDYLENYN